MQSRRSGGGTRYACVHDAEARCTSYRCAVRPGDDTHLVLHLPALLVEEHASERPPTLATAAAPLPWLPCASRRRGEVAAAASLIVACRGSCWAPASTRAERPPRGGWAGDAQRRRPVAMSCVMSLIAGILHRHTQGSPLSDSARGVSDARRGMACRPSSRHLATNLAKASGGAPSVLVRRGRCARRPSKAAQEEGAAAQLFCGPRMAAGTVPPQEGCRWPIAGWGRGGSVLVETRSGTAEC